MFMMKQTFILLNHLNMPFIKINAFINWFEISHLGAAKVYVDTFELLVIIIVNRSQDASSQCGPAWDNFFIYTKSNC